MRFKGFLKSWIKCYKNGNINYMITDINSYRYKQKMAELNKKVKKLMVLRSEIRGLKLEECQLRQEIKQLALELDSDFLDKE